MTERVRAIIRSLLGSAFRVPRGSLAGVPPGPRVLVSNHQSLADAALVWSHLPMPVMGVLEAEHSDERWGQWLLGSGQVVPVGPHRPFALRRLVRHLQAGGSVLMFAEGKITVTGSLMHMYPGAAWLAARARVPLQAVALQGMETGSLSYLKGLQRRRHLVQGFVTAGEPRHLAVAQQRPDRAALRQATVQAVRAAIARNPAFDRPLPALAQECRARFGRDRRLLAEADRWPITLQRLLALPGDRPPGPARLLAAALAAWGEQAGIALPADWWQEPSRLAPGGAALSAAEGSFAPRDLRLFEVEARWRARLRIGDVVFCRAAPSALTFALALLSPLVAGTHSLFGAPPGRRARPWTDDFYDRDASVLLIDRQNIAVLDRQPGALPSSLRSVLVTAPRLAPAEEATILRVCGVLPRCVGHPGAGVD